MRRRGGKQGRRKAARQEKASYAPRARHERRCCRLKPAARKRRERGAPGPGESGTPQAPRTAGGYSGSGQESAGTMSALAGRKMDTSARPGVNQAKRWPSCGTTSPVKAVT